MSITTIRRDTGYAGYAGPSARLGDLWARSAYRAVFETRAGWLRLFASDPVDVPEGLVISGVIDNDSFRLHVERGLVDVLLQQAHAGFSIDTLAPDDAALALEHAALAIIESVEHESGQTIELTDVRVGRAEFTPDTISGQLDWNTDLFAYALSMTNGNVAARIAETLETEIAERAAREAEARSHVEAAQEDNSGEQEALHLVEEPMARAAPDTNDADACAYETSVQDDELNAPLRLQDRVGRVLVGPVLATRVEIGGLAPGAFLILEGTSGDLLSGFLIGPDLSARRIETEGTHVIVFDRATLPDPSEPDDVALYIDLGPVAQDSPSPKLADVMPLQRSGPLALIAGERTVAHGHLVRLGETFGLRIDHVGDAA